MPTTPFHRLLRTILACLALLLAWPVLAQARRTVRVGVHPYPPGIFMDARGQAQGFYVDMLREVAARQGWDLAFEPGTWTGNLERVRTGELDLIAGVARTPEREAFLSFGREGSFTVWSILYAHPSVSILSLLDVKNRRVALMRDDVNGLRFQDLCRKFDLPFTPMVEDTSQAVLAAVAAHRADAGVTSSIIDYSREDAYKVVRTPVVFDPYDLYFATGRGRNLDLLAALDDYLRAGHGDQKSSYQSILNHWLRPREHFEPPRWLAWTGGGLLALLLLAFGASVFLRRQVRAATSEIHELNVKLRQELAEHRQAELERIRSEASRVELEKQVQHAQKLESLGVLAGGIAHDFNNLLTAMLGHLSLARVKLAPESPAAPHLGSLEKIIHRAADLTRQMLAYSGKGRFVVRNHDLNQVLGEMTHLLDVSISKKIALRFNLAEQLPPVRGDAAQIQQVIMNLVTNASDAIGDRDGVIRICTERLSLDRGYLDQVFHGQDLQPGPYVALEVGDTGCGMTPEVKARIFEPFFTTKTTGRGLGLSATQGILRGHRAGMKIYSEPGHGTTFKILFPAVAAPAPVERPADGVRKPLQALRVLLVDDEEVIRQATLASLQALGCTAMAVEDGQAAVQFLERDQAPVDLVLMDLTMPQMDGREAFQIIRRLRPGLPVILSSGYNEQESIQEFLGRGLTGFLQKPYTLQALEDALRSAVGTGVGVG